VSLTKEQWLEEQRARALELQAKLPRIGYMQAQSKLIRLLLGVEELAEGLDGSVTELEKVLSAVRDLEDAGVIDDTEATNVRHRALREHLHRCRHHAMQLAQYPRLVILDSGFGQQVREWLREADGVEQEGEG
jgi:DNA-binding transcriptional ArsR family regulator